MNTNPLKKILMVEDDHDIQTVARFAMESLGGYIVETSDNGLDALDKARGFNPDLILLDVMMPEMDGPATLKAFRSDPVLAAFPVVFMTARVQKHEVAEYKEMGAVDVIAKPFDPMALSTTIQQIWEQYHE